MAFCTLHTAQSALHHPTPNPPSIARQTRLSLARAVPRLSPTPLYGHTHNWHIPTLPGMFGFSANAGGTSMNGTDLDARIVTVVADRATGRADTRSAAPRRNTADGDGTKVPTNAMAATCGGGRKGGGGGRGAVIDVGSRGGMRGRAESGKERGGDGGGAEEGGSGRRLLLRGCDQKGSATELSVSPACEEWARPVCGPPPGQSGSPSSSSRDDSTPRAPRTEAVPIAGRGRAPILRCACGGGGVRLGSELQRRSRGGPAPTGTDAGPPTCSGATLGLRGRPCGVEPAETGPPQKWHPKTMWWTTISEFFSGSRRPTMHGQAP